MREYLENRGVERPRRLDTSEWRVTIVTEGSVELTSIGAAIERAARWVDFDRLA